MDESKRVMELDWWDFFDNQFGNLDPVEAMEKLRRIVNEGGGPSAVNKDPKSLQLMRVIANISD